MATVELLEPRVTDLLKQILVEKIEQQLAARIRERYAKQENSNERKAIRG
jgi:hypothetical protein